MKKITPEILSLADDSLEEAVQLQAAADALQSAPLALAQSFNDSLRARLLVPVSADLASMPRPWRRWGIATAAGLIALFVALLALFLVQRSTRLAFADVVETINQTRTFTAKMEIAFRGVPGVPAGAKVSADISAKNARLRVDSFGCTFVADRADSNVLMLIPLSHEAYRVPIQEFPDLYALSRNYHTATEKPTGQKTINGRQLQGFQVTRNDGASPQVWTFWIDPATKLPVQIDVLIPEFTDPIALTDIHFDTPLDDSLFDTAVPHGYTLVDDPAKVDPRSLHRYAGRITDEHGNPVPNVKITASQRSDALSPGSYSNLADPVTTDKDGRFTLDAGYDRGGISVGFDFSVHHMEPRINDPIRLDFVHPDFIHARLEDMRLLSPVQRTNLLVTLSAGKEISGTVVDSANHPLPQARVEAVYSKPEYGRFGDDIRLTYSKVVMTDDAGRFRLRGLMPENVVIQIRCVADKQPVLWGQAAVNLRESGLPDPIHITAAPFQLPAGKVVHELFGIQLVDVDDDLRARLSLTSYEHVLILDPGPNAARLHLNDTAQGDCFWYVAQERIKDFKDFARQLLQACENQKKSGRSDFKVPVDYTTLHTGQSDWSEHFLSLNAADLAELEQAIKQ